MDSPVHESPGTRTDPPSHAKKTVSPPDHTNIPPTSSNPRRTHNYPATAATEARTDNDTERDAVGKEPIHDAGMLAVPNRNVA